MYAGNLLLIAGGQSKERTESAAYALSLDPEVDVPDCLAAIPNFPHSFEVLRTKDMYRVD